MQWDHADARTVSCLCVSWRVQDAVKGADEYLMGAPAGQVALWEKPSLPSCCTGNKAHLIHVWREDLKVIFNGSIRHMWTAESTFKCTIIWVCNWDNTDQIHEHKSEFFCQRSHRCSSIFHRLYVKDGCNQWFLGSFWSFYTLWPPCWVLRPEGTLSGHQGEVSNYQLMLAS